MVEYWWNNWKKLTWFAESLEPVFHKSGYFFCNQKTWVSTAWRIIGDVLQSWGIEIFVCNDADKLAWNYIRTFLLRRHFLLHKWPSSKRQFSKWKALNIQWFSLWKKSSKSWHYFCLTNITRCCFATNIKTLNSMKWLTLLLVVQIEV